MVRVYVLLIAILLAGLLVPAVASAELEYHHNGLAIGVGFNQATQNEADESFAASIKYRRYHWEAGFDACMSEDFGGVGDNNFGVAWLAYIEEFNRPADSTYGLYAGLGAGMFILEDEFIDQSVGPLAVAGWDWGDETGSELKAGWFGDSFWASLIVYWYF
jgi:hypothetical protein